MNLPDGTYVGHIPGNTYEDELFDALVEKLKYEIPRYFSTEELASAIVDYLRNEGSLGQEFEPNGRIEPDYGYNGMFCEAEKRIREGL